MIITKNESGRYIAQSTFAEKDVLKAAGWRWDAGNKHWYTDDESKGKLFYKEYDFPTFNISSPTGYDFEGWRKDEVWQNNKYGKKFLPDLPDFLFILSVTSTYYSSENACCYGGIDAGYFYKAVCREATSKETAPLIRQEQKTKLQRESQEELEKIFAELHENGEYPTNVHHTEYGGDNLFVSRSDKSLYIYGGGHYFVITDKYIWTMEENGSDGGDWSRNNITSTVARRIPFDAEIANRILALHKIIFG